MAIPGYSLSVLGGDIDSRARTDRRLYFWTDAVLLPLVTLGIWGFVLIYRLINRRDEHFRREAQLDRDLLQSLKDRLQARSVDPYNLPEMAALERAIRDKEMSEQPRNAVLWLIVSLVTSGLGTLVIEYFATVDWYYHEQRQIEVVRRSNALLAAANIPASLQYTYDEVLPERHFWLNLIATMASFGIWGIWWGYHMLADGNRHYENQWRWEDSLSTQIAAL